MKKGTEAFELMDESSQFYNSDNVGEHLITYHHIVLLLAIVWAYTRFVIAQKVTNIKQVQLHASMLVEINLVNVMLKT